MRKLESFFPLFLFPVGLSQLFFGSSPSFPFGLSITDRDPSQAPLRILSGGRHMRTAGRAESPVLTLNRNNQPTNTFGICRYCKNDKQRSHPIIVVASPRKKPITYLLDGYAHAVHTSSTAPKPCKRDKTKAADAHTHSLIHSFTHFSHTCTRHHSAKKRRFRRGLLPMLLGWAVTVDASANHSLP